MLLKFCILSLVLLATSSDAQEERPIVRLWKRVKQLEEEMDTVGSELDTVESNVNNLGSELDNVGSEMDAVKSDVNSLGSELDTIKSDVDAIETKKLAVCGYQDVVDVVITYDSIVAEVNEFGGKPLDISSGKFTAPVTGLYEVSAAAERCYVPGDGADQYVDLYMNDNDRRLERFMNQYKLDSGGMATPCSGFRYVQLDEGDNLYLKYGGGSAILGLKFCITLYTTTE